MKQLNNKITNMKLKELINSFLKYLEFERNMSKKTIENY
jgi:site-specific recombinase XerD